MLSFEGAFDSEPIAGTCPSSTLISSLGRDTLTALSSAPDAWFSGDGGEEEAMIVESKTTVE